MEHWDRSKRWASSAASSRLSTAGKLGSGVGLCSTKTQKRKTHKHVFQSSGPYQLQSGGGGSEACQQSWQHRQHKQRLYERMSVNQSQERRHCEQGQQGNKSKQGKVGKQGTLWVHIL